ncbi:hypothetical protein [Streptacidiphilus neutrinimicus]|uniref:hypothetical protein n=1 Tax=Streptacidiphilus neutrinimicus TaxID=105420 RepID=UPI0006937B83|nr:hypothetical protein [Streptacidiphilus neutrinimicus]
MLTRAEVRRISRMDRWLGIIGPRLVRHLVSGCAAQPRWLPRRWLTLVSGDVDRDAGVGAMWLVWRPGSAKAETHTALFERCGETWQHFGGGGRFLVVWKSPSTARGGSATTHRGCGA